MCCQNADGRWSTEEAAWFCLNLMGFLAFCCLFLLRLNLSVTIVTMTDIPRRLNSAKAEDFGPRYDWGDQIQGDVLAAFGYGYMVTLIGGDVIAEVVGPRLVVFCALLLMGILTVMTPLAASTHWGVLMVVRTFIGLGGGTIYPAIHNLIAEWRSPDTEGGFVWPRFGGVAGMVLTFPLVAGMIKLYGWQGSFYVLGVFAIILSIIWILTVRRSPIKHSKQTEYGSGIGLLKTILGSPPFLALLLCHYGNLWGLFLLLNMLPKFTVDLLDFDLALSGGMSSLPFLARAIFAVVCSTAGGYLGRHQIFTNTVIRRIFVTFSHVMAGIAMFFVGYMGKSAVSSMTLLTVSLGMNGAATMSCISNPYDLSPNYASTLHNILNRIGATTGFIVPMIAGRILERKNDYEQWRLIFIIGGLFYIIPGIIFVLFGSGLKQPWNTPKDIVKVEEDGEDQAVRNDGERDAETAPPQSQRQSQSTKQSQSPRQSQSTKQSPSSKQSPASKQSPSSKQSPASKQSSGVTQ